MSRRPVVSYFRPEDVNDGVTLFGKRVAQTLRDVGAAQVVEITDNARSPRSRGAISSVLHYRALGVAMNAADIAHVEYRPTYFRGQARLDGRFFHFRSMITRPLLLSVHDVFDAQSDQDDSWLMGHTQGRLKRAVKRGLLLRTAPARAHDLRAYRRLVEVDLYRSADRVIVHTSEQRERLLKRGVEPERVQVLLHPLLVERSAVPHRQAKRALGLEDRFVVTKLGFLHDRKDYDTVLRAIARTPPPVTLLIAGGAFPGDDDRRRAIEAQAHQLGIAQRVKITGLLDEAGLRTAVAATDLAVASFHAMSASGSVAVWIAQGTPLVAVDLPPIAELQALAPGSMDTFAVGDVDALADRIADEVSNAGPSNEKREAMATLHKALSIEHYATSLLDIYADIVSETR